MQTYPYFKADKVGFREPRHISTLLYYLSTKLYIIFAHTDTHAILIYKEEKNNSKYRDKKHCKLIPPSALVYFSCAVTKYEHNEKGAFYGLII